MLTIKDNKRAKKTDEKKKVRKQKREKEIEK